MPSMPHEYQARLHEDLDKKAHELARAMMARRPDDGGMPKPRSVDELVMEYARLNSLVMPVPTHSLFRTHEPDRVECPACGYDLTPTTGSR